MGNDATGAMQRRMVLGGVLAGAAGLRLPPWQTRGRVVIQRGVFGGGSLQLESSQANFSIAASRLIFPDENREIVLGTLVWNEAPSGLELVSTRVTNYGRLDLPPDQGQGRRVTGTAVANGGTEYPFVLEVIDAGEPGTGADAVNLRVGDGVETGKSATPATGLGFSYAASGPLVTGDIRAADVEIDIESGTVGPAPPAS